MVYVISITLVNHVSFKNNTTFLKHKKFSMAIISYQFINGHKWRAPPLPTTTKICLFVITALIFVYYVSFQFQCSKVTITTNKFLLILHERICFVQIDEGYCQDVYIHTYIK